MSEVLSGPVHVLWLILGATGGVIFYGRFYVQWWASEREKRSVMPVAFWYMSSVGSLMLLVYAVHEQSPVGALGQSLNIVIYSRNLVHIWRENGRLTKAGNAAIHAAVAAISTIAVVLVIHIWLSEYHHTQTITQTEANQVWFWLALGVAGQALFASRFIIQWIATELKRRSVVPRIFWHISIVASLLQLACFWQRQEWIFALGMIANILVYTRNIWFIHANPETPDNAAKMA
ncbi:MAG: lipid-A-disaccharide synthase N-terminal domain-containing protein [Candidatus Hydrogenedentes bacterium]|nr:lipid-A-disaccharide synthase N-terminal domain-containing protein [Candidatus Hydrogenedentota bacterium]